MAAKVPDWPEAESPFLIGLIEAFKKRSKAIKYKLSKWEAEFARGVDGERLSLDVLCLDRSLRLSMWNDGTMWIRACAPRPHKSGGGWRFLYAFHMEAINNSPEAVVGAFEASFHKAESAEELERVWSAFSPRMDASL